MPTLKPLQSREGPFSLRLTDVESVLPDPYFHTVLCAVRSCCQKFDKGRKREQSSTDYASGFDSSDEARFRHFAATSLMMTNQIGVARTILANLPITRHSQNRGRPLLGYVPLAPHRAPPRPSRPRARDPPRLPRVNNKQCAEFLGCARWECVP